MGTCGCDEGCRPLSLLTGNQGNPGADGQDGTFGANSDLYLFNTATVGNPTNGKLLFNNANLSAATSISVSNIDGYTNTVTTWLAALNTSDATLKGFIRVNKEFDSTSFAMYSVSAATANAGYYTYTVTYLGGSGNSPFASGDNVIFSYVISGNNGAAGTQGIVLIPLTYPTDIVLPPAAGATATTTTTYNIPANTMVADGDIVEFEADVVTLAVVAPVINNIIGAPDVDHVSYTPLCNSVGLPVFTDAPSAGGYGKIKMSLTRTGAATGIINIEFYTLQYGIYTITLDAGVVNYAANIPMDIQVTVTLGPLSTVNAPPYSQIVKAIMKYYAA